MNSSNIDNMIKKIHAYYSSQETNILATVDFPKK